ncbi:MAG TPA: alpha/beta fold hydrolase [Solirubrobacterales bacterium]|jgi:pimeloyl-ACP methyl ester carboxylesterase|nr:alpha/beta fold hydrolase [Solirubrobacterales bacterium]
MPPAAATQFTAGEGLALRGERVGEGPPVVLCHGITATRRYVLHGSRALERAGHAVVSYDARGHGESDPAPAGQGYGYPELVGDLEAVAAATVGEGRFVLAGHSMGAHTAVAYALRRPERLAGLVVIGPVYRGGEVPQETLRFWDGLAAALKAGGVDGFLEYIDREQGFEPAWRETILRFTRERMLLHRHPDALVEALRQVPRSRPFGELAELESLELPVLVVASHDVADPGHPRAVAEAYAGRLPRARLIGEAEGESPLAWQGGRLSREVAAFCAERDVAASLGGS